MRIEAVLRTVGAAEHLMTRRQAKNYPLPATFFSLQGGRLCGIIYWVCKSLSKAMRI